MKIFTTKFSLLLFFSFVIVKNGTSQSVNFTTAQMTLDIAVDSSELWAATFNGGVSCVNLNTGQKKVYTVANSLLLSNLVDIVFIDKSGNKWFGGRGVCKLEGTKWSRFYYIPNGDSLWIVLQIRQHPNGKIYVLGGNGISSMLAIDDTLINSLNLSGMPSQYPAIDFDIDSIGNFWFATSDGVMKFDGSNWTVYNMGNSAFLGNDINTIEIDKKGVIWALSSSYQAIYYFNGVIWIRLPKIPIAREASKGRVIVDNQNNKYFYRYHNNVYKYDTSWTVLTSAAGQIASANVSSFLPAANGIIYSAAYGNSVGCYNGSNLKFINVSAYDFKSNYFNSVTRSKDNKIAACDFYDIYITNGIGFQKLQAPPSFQGDLNVIRYDAQNNLWLGAARGNYLSTTPTLAKYDGNNWTIFQGFQQDVYDIETQANGDIWIATSGGAYKAAFGQVPSTSGPGLNRVYSVTVDTSGNTWYANGTGISSTVFGRFDYTNAPMDTNSIAFVKADSKGNVWTNGTNGILKFTGNSYVLYTPSNSTWSGGSGINGIRSMCEDEAGTLYFGTSKGIIKYDGINFILYDKTIYRMGFLYPIDIVLDANDNIWYAGWDILGLFNPGNPVFGEYDLPNLIKGKIYHDVNANSNHDSSEAGLTNVNVMLEPDSIYQLSDYLGNYEFHTGTGVFNVSAANPVGWHQTGSQPIYTVPVDSSVECCYDFGMDPDSAFHNMQLSLSYAAPRCNATTPLWIDVYNAGSVAEDVQVYYECDSLTPLLSFNPTPTIAFGNKLYWNFSQLAPYESKSITLSVKIPNQSFSGHTLHYKANLLSMLNGAVLDSKYFTDEISCAYDPNDKSVKPVGVDSAHYTLMSEKLEYTIRFQNTGTDTAFTVLLYDTLDPSLDIATFQFLGSSHPVSVKYDNQGNLRFSFNHIQLPDSHANPSASNGFIRYSIKAKPNLPSNTIVNNKAYIFFDFNLPVITKTVFNTLVYSLSTTVIDYSRPESLILYPNPVTDEILNLDMAQTLRFPATFDLFDLNGRLVYSKKIPASTNRFSLHLPALRNGIYLGILDSEGERIIRKIALMH